jgi:RNA polymerase sigma-70 factor (ECF subfamily)
MLQAMTCTEPGPDFDELLNSARDGDQREFEAFYRATCGTVYGLCLRLTANPTVAEECVQQTFIQAWRNLTGFRGDSAVTTWLHRIAINEVRGHYRREARHDVSSSDEDQPALTTDHGRSIDLERAIATLPERARAVFVLVGIYGYPHDQTAAMLDIAVGTSKAHYHHARRQLRKELGDSL